MHSRFLAYALMFTVLVGGFGLVADALVESDEEQLGEVADELTGARSAERVEAVLRRIDLSREPVRLDDGTRTQWFAEDDGHRLSERVSSALADLETDDLEVVQRSVRVDGDRGTVAVRVRADSELRDVTLHFVRSGQGWLIGRVQTR